jgi:spore maturation protein CgeB
MKVFGVDYQFMSCGSVFTDGLAHAASDLGIEYAHADWSEPQLMRMVAEFDPDLLFVVHGRKFTQWWGPTLAATRSYQAAVWLLDEPYEVDDTATFSPRFDHAFLSDPATLDRHPNASYLPVCYDPHVHRHGSSPRVRKVGFVGGCNGTRDRYLAVLARAGVLDYVVGGEWTEPLVRAVCVSPNVKPSVTAALYGETRIVLNVFRETHHYNSRGTVATSLNPRVYEALACGALVVSEWRPELDTMCPELPTFRTEAECVDTVQWLLSNPIEAEDLRVTCAERLKEHTYAARLQTVLATVGAQVAA